MIGIYNPIFDLHQMIVESINTHNYKSTSYEVHPLALYEVSPHALYEVRELEYCNGKYSVNDIEMYMHMNKMIIDHSVHALQSGINYPTIHHSISSRYGHSVITHHIFQYMSPPLQAYDSHILSEPS